MLYIKVPDVLPSVNEMIPFQVEKPVLIRANNLSTASIWLPIIQAKFKTCLTQFPYFNKVLKSL